VCRGEQPDLNQLAEKFEGQVTFIGVSNNDTVADGKAYVTEFGVPYAMAHAPEVWALYDDPLRPTTVVIDGEGNLVHETNGPIDPEVLNDAIEEALDA
jgi:peroxiredoxin